MAQVQDIHAKAPLRLGGIVIVMTMILALPRTASLGGGPLSGLILAAACPILILAAWDDLISFVGARFRLVASFVSAALYLFMSGIRITDVGFAPVDFILSVPYVDTIFVAICFVALIQAFNLIDGVNGLSATIFVISSLAIGAVALRTGLYGIFFLSVIASAATCGFLLLNYPSGALFLGDFGSYFLGFMVGALAINVAASPDAIELPNILLILFWPCFELVTTSLRRIVAGHSIFRPDRGHTHTLVFRLLRILGAECRSANNLAALICVLAALPPTIVGGLMEPGLGDAWMICAGFSAFYLAFRACSPRIARALARRRKLQASGARAQLPRVKEARAPSGYSAPMPHTRHAVQGASVDG